MKVLIAVPLLIILISGCVNVQPVQNGQKFDYISDKNPEIFNISQFNEQGVISRTDENMGCLAVSIGLVSYLGKDIGSQCVSLGPNKYSITGPSICGGVNATVFEKVEQNEMCGTWYHVRLDNGVDGWLSQNFFREKICLTNEDCQKIYCTTPVGGGGCEAANQNFTHCEDGMCKV